MIDIKELKLVLLIAAIFFASWLMFGRGEDTSDVSLSDKYIIERAKQAEENVIIRDLYIDSLEIGIANRDIHIKKLYNDTLRIHNFYTSGNITRAQRDSARHVLNPR